VFPRGIQIKNWRIDPETKGLEKRMHALEKELAASKGELSEVEKFCSKLDKERAKGVRENGALRAECDRLSSKWEVLRRHWLAVARDASRKDGSDVSKVFQAEEEAAEADGLANMAVALGKTKAEIKLMENQQQQGLIDCLRQLLSARRMKIEATDRGTKIQEFYSGLSKLNDLSEKSLGSLPVNPLTGGFIITTADLIKCKIQHMS
jgi:hypothetical protein